MYNGKIVRLLLSTNINIPIKVWGIFPYLNNGFNFANIHVGIYSVLLRYNFTSWLLDVKHLISGRICKPLIYKATPVLSFRFIAFKFINQHFSTQCLTPVFSDSKKFPLVSYFIPICRYYIVVDGQSNFNNLHS